MSPSRSISTAVGAPSSSQGSNCTRSREELPDRARGGHRRQREQDAGDAVQLAAREQAEDDEQRMQAERVRHHVRDDDVALDLVDEDEEREHPEHRDRVDDEGVDRGRDGREPGPDVGDHLDHGRPDAEQERVLVGPRHEPGAAEDPHADPGAEADHGREDQLPAHVARERLLDPQRQRQAGSRWKAAVDEPLEPLHVEQHVDRDDDDQDEVEERHDDRERGALGERERVLRVLRDLARAEVVGPVGRLLLDLDALEAVRVEPVLEPVDVLLGAGLASRVRRR